jgi:hypothetical protein
MSGLPEISDDDMRRMMATTQPYSVVVLHRGPRYADNGARAIIWEHGRRNFALRAAGRLAVVCPVHDDSDLAGIGIFAADVAETEALMAEDPAVRAGVLVSEVHASRSFPGDALPGWA